MVLKYYFKAAVFSSLLMAPLCYADVPVVDATASVNTIESATPLTLDQRVNKLERQISNITQMDLIAQINNLQQQMQKLQGQLDEQSHQVKQLTDQVRTQYKDLEQRVVSPNQSPAAKPVQIPMLPAAPPATDNVFQEQKVYQQAYNLLHSRDYVRATTALQDFLSRYPNSTYAANAHYWLGEIYLLQGQPDPAISEFNVVITHYPTHPKMPEAMLKVGFAYYDKGELEKGKAQLVKVQKQFPGTATAQLAAARLQEVRQQTKGT